MEGRRDDGGGVAYAKAKENHPTKRQLFQKLLPFLLFFSYFIFPGENEEEKKSILEMVHLSCGLSPSHAVQHFRGVVTAEREKKNDVRGGPR